MFKKIALTIFLFAINSNSYGWWHPTGYVFGTAWPTGSSTNLYLSDAGLKNVDTEETVYLYFYSGIGLTTPSLFYPDVENLPPGTYVYWYKTIFMQGGRPYMQYRYSGQVFAEQIYPGMYIHTIHYRCDTYMWITY